MSLWNFSPVQQDGTLPHLARPGSVVDFDSPAVDPRHASQDPDDIYEFCPYDTGSDLRLDSENPAESLQLEKRGVTSQIPGSPKHTSPAEFQGNFWTKQTIFKNSIAAKLRTIGEHQIASDLEECHSRLTYAKCGDCGTVKKFLNRCDRFYCPECQPRLSRDRKESVEWWTKQIAQPKHVVLTIRNTADLTKEHVKKLKDWFGKLRRRRFARNWRGGFYSIECTNEGRGWHLHIHALVDARYIDASALAQEWNDVTGSAGYIVKVKDCRQKSYLQEVTKYAVKGSDLAGWKAEQILEFIAAFDGVRQFGVFGTLYGKRTEWADELRKIKADHKNCSCGSCNIKFFSEFEWEVLQAQLTPQMSAVPKPTRDHWEFGFVREIDSLAKH